MERREGLPGSPGPESCGRPASSPRPAPGKGVVPGPSAPTPHPPPTISQPSRPSCLNNSVLSNHRTFQVAHAGD